MSTTGGRPITCRSGSVGRIAIRRVCIDVDRHHTGACTSPWVPGPILAVVIGIFGGTFDPPHMGHLAVAMAAVEQLDLAKLLLIPAGEPWQKSDSEVTLAEHRLAMTKLAAAEDRRFVVDDREVRRSGPSYTIDTVKDIGEPCVLVLGSDAAAGIPTWSGGEELLELASVAVVERPGVSHRAVEEALGVPVALVSMPSVELSATALRDHIKAGLSPRFLVPEAVCDYIEAHRLYR